MEWFTFEALAALLTLTGLEVILGIDNVVVIAVVVGKLKPESQAFARRLGLLLAMVARLALLFSIAWLMKLTEPLFGIGEHEISGRDIILILGGLFLVGKATLEVHHTIEGDEPGEVKKATSLRAALAQIIVLDLIFSLDSVITAVGMTDKIPIMVAAIIIAITIMLVFAGTVSHFIDKHPTLKMLALSFILLIGVMLVADGFGKHIERGYIYFAMFFSLGVEVLNLVASSKRRAAKIAHA